MDDRNYVLRQRSESRLLMHDFNSLEASNPNIDYAREPLLRLDEACAPLVNIVDDIFKYVAIALQNTSQEPPDGLTHDESASIRLYTMEWTHEHQSLYAILNHILRTNNHNNLQPWSKYLKLFLTALLKLPCAPPQTVWRGIRKNIIHAFPPGEQVIWWSFSSCTKSLAVLQNNLYLGNEGDRTLFSIELFNGRVIRAHSHFDVEDEILMLPGTFMEVQSQLNPAPDLYIVHLKQKIPKATLLEPPFEGACVYPTAELDLVMNFSKRHWYRQRKVLICISSMIVVVLIGIIFGSIFGSRSVIHSTETTTSWCPTNGWNVCVFTTRVELDPVGYYGSQYVNIDCNQALANITVVITVQRTLGASYAKQYNDFPSGILIETYNETSDEIFFVWNTRSEQIIDFSRSPHYVNAQFQLAGIPQAVSNDMYAVVAEVACNGAILTKTGYF